MAQPVDHSSYSDGEAAMLVREGDHWLDQKARRERRPFVRKMYKAWDLETMIGTESARRARAEAANRRG